MPTWVWVLCILFASLGALLGLVALVLFLFRVHYLLEWRGALDGGGAGTARVTYGFLGFRRTWEPLKDASWNLADLIGDEDDAEVNTEDANATDDTGRKPGAGPRAERTTTGSSETPETEPPETAPGFSERPAARPEETGIPVFLESPGTAHPSPKARAPKRDPHRGRRALFRLVTDPDAWKLLGRYGLKTARLLLRLLDPRVEAAVGHPDPAFLGRVSGTWYAARPFLPFGRHVDVYFRFQDRSPSLWVRAEGRFSGLSVLGFGLRLLIAFPSLRLARRALHSWRRHRLTGWRAWVYRRLQTG